jgi:hypothetical protein
VSSKSPANICFGSVNEFLSGHGKLLGSGLAWASGVILKYSVLKLLPGGIPPKLASFPAV